jgi:hypothetical protein
VEAVVILILAAGVSAAVVWWAMASPETPAGSPSDAATTTESASPGNTDGPPEGFVLMPTDGPVLTDDRPPAAVSLIRLAITIAFVAAAWVLVVTLLGWLVKLQFDDYFYRLVS